MIKADLKQQPYEHYLGILSNSCEKQITKTYVQPTNIIIMCTYIQPTKKKLLTHTMILFDFFLIKKNKDCYLVLLGFFFFFWELHKKRSIAIPVYFYA